MQHLFYTKELKKLQENFEYDNRILNNFDVEFKDNSLILHFINSQGVSTRGYSIIPFIQISQQLNVHHDFFFFKIEALDEDKILEKYEIFYNIYEGVVKTILDIKDKYL